MSTQTTNTTVSNYGSAPQWSPSEEAGEMMNRLVRGETSAVEAMEQVLEKLEEPLEIQRVQSMLNDHRGFVAYFRTMALKQAKKPEPDSGAWGSFVEFFVGTAKLFGNKSALKALKEGHEHGIKEYKKLLDHNEVPSNVKTTVREKMIPALDRHIASINEMMEMQ